MTTRVAIRRQMVKHAWKMTSVASISKAEYEATVSFKKDSLIKKDYINNKSEAQK
jgi:hypothetical protein